MQFFRLSDTDGDMFAFEVHQNRVRFKKKNFVHLDDFQVAAAKGTWERVQSDGPSPCSSAHTVPALTVLISITVQTLKIQSTGMYQSI